MRLSTIVKLAIGMAFSVGCGSGQPVETLDVDVQETLTTDGARWELVLPDVHDVKSKDTVIFPDLAPDPGGPGDVDYELGDTPVFDTAPNCDEQPLPFGCVCQDNDDCAGGWCVQAPAGKVCTSTCMEECPEGYSCELLAGTCPDCQQVCLPMWVNLCRPCTSNNDCQQPGFSQGNLCLDQAAAGSFCGYECQTSHECPTGFLCKDVESDDGVTKQCVKQQGECPCSPLFVSAGATTTCFVKNQHGTCTGERKCTAEGLTQCDAALPAPEVCDGLDNDCDGSFDEENNICGNTGKVCKCEGESCTCGCPEPLEDCGFGDCIDLQTSVAHCSQCNAPCLADNVDTFFCQGGKCKIVKCAGGWDDYNGILDDGCECMRDRLSHGYLPPHEPFECPVLAVTVGVRGLMDKGGEEALGECTVAMEEELKHVAGEA